MELHRNLKLGPFNLSHWKSFQKSVLVAGECSFPLCLSFASHSFVWSYTFFDLSCEDFKSHAFSVIFSVSSCHCRKEHSFCREPLKLTYFLPMLLSLVPSFIEDFCVLVLLLVDNIRPSIQPWSRRKPQRTPHRTLQPLHREWSPVFEHLSIFFHVSYHVPLFSMPSN